MKFTSLFRLNYLNQNIDLSGLTIIFQLEPKRFEACDCLAIATDNKPPDQRVGSCKPDIIMPDLSRVKAEVIAEETMISAENTLPSHERRIKL